MRWYKTASRVSLDMSIPRQMIENMVSKARHSMDEKERLAKTPLDIEEYRKMATQSMSKLDDGMRETLAPMVYNAIDEVKSGNLEPLSDVISYILGNMRKQWGECRGIWNVLTKLDDHASSSGGESAKQMEDKTAV